MALHYPDNRYPGVNAHLNSHLQQPVGLWSSFHSDFSHAIKTHLNAGLLPENYYAIVETGLQITMVGLDKIMQKSTTSDVSVLQTAPTPASRTAASASPYKTIALSDLDELLSEEDLLVRVGVSAPSQMMHAGSW